VPRSSKPNIKPSKTAAPTWLLEGEVTVLCRLMTRRFGPISEATQARLDNATLEQLEQWTDNILEAATLDDVFKEN
jgi:hypothetical protein